MNKRTFLKAVVVGIATAAVPTALVSGACASASEPRKIYYNGSWQLGYAEPLYLRYATALVGSYWYEFAALLPDDSEAGSAVFIAAAKLSFDRAEKRLTLDV